MKRIQNQLFIFFLFNVFSNCVSIAKIPVVESAPPNFFETMKGTRSIGIYVDDIPNSAIDDWKNTIHASIENRLNNFNYFKIIDIKNRSQRLKEIKFAQQIGNDFKSLGAELSIQGLLYVEIPEPPKFDCKLSTQSRSETYCLARDKEGKCLKQGTRTITSYVQTLNYIVFANAKLINVSSGLSITAANTKPAILKNYGASPLVNCPSLTQGHSSAIQIASETIAETISPKVSPFSVPLFSSADGVRDDTKAKQVESHLESGLAWIDSSPPNFELAKKDWEKAVSLSANTSANAFWNLSVFYWQAGDIPKAEEFFNKSIETGGPRFLDSQMENLKLIFRNKRRDVINKFYEEKKRYQFENAQAFSNIKILSKNLFK